MKKDIVYIDSIKGIGALIIAFYHISGLIGIPNSSVSFINRIMQILSDIGYIPVEMFFFFSGYLMLYNYSEKIKNITFLDYIKRRVGKLYPFLFVNIIMGSLYILVIGGHLDLYNITYNLLFLQGGYFLGGGDFRIDSIGGGTWFLSPLILSYFLFFYICKYKDEEKAFGLYSLIVLLGISIMKISWNFPIVNGYMMRGLIGFFMGCVFYSIVKRYGFKISRLSLLVMFIISILYISLISSGKYSSTLDFIIITDLILMPCIVLIFENITWMRKIFSSRILKKIGEFSLPLFFLNLPVGYFFELFISNRFEIHLGLQYVLYFISLFSLSMIFVFMFRRLRIT